MLELILVGLVCYVTGKAAEMEGQSFIVWAFVAVLVCFVSSAAVMIVFGVPFVGALLGAALSFGLLMGYKALANR
ncbi:hypothetical protein [Alienimonas chondri]|uniref:Uncharacterized protein n=1 Tax=Alienimonas chondri TaxID=2681879 RepID=A0ABX1V7R8_9PLAN|nr:hypothetical protein [Alienimonas chondri]NNJ24253.1 hypothetical protein [Alienimonas chondri]